jgi:hypothetical protein
MHLVKGVLPWKTGLLIDSTLHQRSTLHTKSAKRFNHGKGFVIGHQWPNIVLLINEMIIPLPPIAFHSKKYCRKNNLKYKTENESLVEYLAQLNLQDYVGDHNPDEVVVLAHSGYDDKKIVHWVYCVYILLHARPPGIPDHVHSLPDRQRRIKEIVDSKEKARMIQLLTQIDGVERCKNELRQAIE